jgi:transposase
VTIPDAMKERASAPGGFWKVQGIRLHQAREAHVEDYDGRQIVGMDLHRRRSVLVRMSEDGRKLGSARIANSPAALRQEIARAGKHPQVVLEATYGWHWAADTLAEAGAEVHLAHPLGVKAFTYRRVKDDFRDAADLADLLRMGRLPEAWIAPAEVRELREVTRYRRKLVGLRTSCKDQVHAVLAKLGVAVTHSDLFGPGGREWLNGLALPQPYSGKVCSLLHLTGELDAEIGMLTDVTRDLLAGHRGYQVIQQLPGIGPVLAAVIVAEIGDVTRFRTAAQLCSWAGLTPRHRESDLKVARGHVTKQGSRTLRWALTEAIQRLPEDSVIGSAKAAIIARRGKEAKNIAKVAAARKLLTLVYYGLRDGQIRALARPAAPAAEPSAAA